MDRPIGLMGFKEIPIFKYFDRSAAETLTPGFSLQVVKKGERILTFGKVVPGIYIVVEGIFGVFTESAETALAKIERGGCFGEMSLIEEGQTSSANIDVISDEASLLFCERGKFMDYLASSESLAMSFYRGAAEMLSKRLRSTNDAISKQLDMAQSTMQQIYESNQLSQFLGKTRSTIDDTGSNMVGQLLSLVMELSDIGKRIEGLVLVESQNFDVISQQMDLIMQFFENMRRVLKGEEALDLKGDVRLMEK